MESKKIITGIKLKKSQYAFFIPMEDDYIIYSSLNGFIAVCRDKICIQKINRIINSEVVEYGEFDEFIQILFDKGILIEAEYNEEVLVNYLYETEVSQDKTLQLMLFVTLDCNFRCIYCAQKHEKNVMDVSIYDRISNFIRMSLENKQYNAVRISFFGGEPLLEYKNIVYFLEKLDGISKEFNVDITSSMTTNGYLLSPKRFEKLVSLKCNGYQITIDGTAESHDKTRVLINGFPTWNVIMDNLKYANSTDLDFSITIRTNYNSEVLGDLKSFYKFIGETFDRRFSVYYETIKKQGGENDDQLDVLDDISGILGGVRIERILKENCIRSSNSLNRTIPTQMICYATKPNFFAIYYDGTIKKCSHYLSIPENTIGFINEKGEMKIDKKKHALWISNYSAQIKTCKECKILPLCFGKRCVASMVQYGKMNCFSEIETIKVENTIESSINK